MTSIIPKVTQLSPLVIRVLGCNPGPMTLQGTNTYLIGNGPRRVLLDTGEPSNEEYIHSLKDTLLTNNISLDCILISHWHNDHIGGVNDVLSLNKDKVSVKKFKEPSADSRILVSVSCDSINDGNEIKVDGATLRIIHTPGHTTDHIVVKLCEENTIFSGDCILGEGTAVFEDLYTYMKSLKTILDEAPARIYPGHGPVIDDPVTRIKYYIDHRNKRERQIFALLKSSPGKKFTAMNLVKIIYEKTPSHLYIAAAKNVRQHLEKLEKEGKLNRIDDNYWMFINNKL